MHTLDLVITKADDPIVFNIDTFDPAISDHKAVTFNLKLNKPPAVSKTISYRSPSKINIDKILAHLTQSGITQYLPDHLSEVVNIYNGVLTKLLDPYAPVKLKTIVEKNQFKMVH